VIVWAFASVWVFCVASTALWAALRARRPAIVRCSGEVRVLVVRPCAGAEPHLEECLASSARLSARLAPEVIFALESTSDGAAPAAERACARVAARIIYTAATGPNRKADQIARAMRGLDARFDTIVIADSDVDLRGVDLEQLIAPLENDPNIAAVWAPPVERERPVTLGDRASQAVLGGSMHAFPLLAALDPRGMVGKLVAIRREALDAAGGFEPLVEHLGEDMELARAFAAAGKRVEVAPMLALSRASRRPLRTVIARYARWIAVIRTQRAPLVLAYPLLFAATPLICVLSMASIAFGAPIAFALATTLFALVTRLAIAARAQRAAGRRASSALIDSVLADGVLLAAFALAMTRKTVTWRARTLVIDGRGLLRPAREEAAR
jgi:ceramide glucosyltransferase